jgi:DNA-binding transcriptional regulator YdaS (Cro superfamily)
MANSIGISRTWMALLISKSRLPSAELCNAIDLYTNGEVACEAKMMITIPEILEQYLPKK